MMGYEVGALLGRGGMGEVYQGRHLSLDRPVAIKFLRGALAEDAEFRERFLREARLCARLSPFAAATPLSVMHMQVTRPAPVLPDWVWPCLREAVARALAKDPAQRYLSAATMHQALEQCQTASAEQRAPAAGPISGSSLAPGGAQVEGTPRANSRAALILAAITLVVIGIVGAFSHHASSRTPGGASPGTSGSAESGSPGGSTAGAGLSKSSPERSATDGSAGGKAGASVGNEGTMDTAAKRREPEPFAGERFPETRTRQLSAGEIRAWSPDDRRDAINEMYARHGYDFMKKGLKEHFLRFSWYRHALEPGRRDVTPFLSEIERQNLASIARARVPGP
jgi:hypothetical protein